MIIVDKKVVSKPGAAIEVTALTLSPEAVALLTLRESFWRRVVRLLGGAQ